jgi:hypothetical protein
MNVPWDAIALTVRQTAPGLLICASVLIASLLVLQAWSTMVGVGVGAIAAVLAGAHWKSDSLPTAQMWLYGTSSFLLLVLGVLLDSDFLNELSPAGPKGIENPEQRPELPLQIQGLVVVAWIIFVEGVEIIATWAAANAQYGASAASVGVLVSFSLVGALAGALFATGIFRDLRRDLLQGLAAVTITSSGAYFLARWAAAVS